MSSSKIMPTSLDDSVFDLLMQMGNNDGTVILALLSDDERQNEWAFRQPEIGRILNDIYELNSEDLVACNTVEEIANNNNALIAIANHEYALETCTKNEIISSKMGLSADEFYISLGLAHSRYNVGDIVQLTYNGELRPFRVVHKDYITQGKVVLASEEIMENSAWISTSSQPSKYSTSTIRSFLNNTMISRFSDIIQAAMVMTGVTCHDFSTQVICNDKLWIPSATEINASINMTSYVPVEGSAFDYFTDDDSRNKGAEWWTRTPYTDSSSYPNKNFVAYVNNNGSAISTKANHSSLGVICCFEI